jgi:hypothetical protein
VALRLVASPGGPIRKVGERLEWTCRACATVNPIDEVACRVCGSSMLELFRPPEAARPPRDARAAAWLSVVPGLGVSYAGQPALGVAQSLLWLWWLVTTAAFWARPGPLLLLVKAVFLLATAAIWGLSAVDARRLASRRPPLLGQRALAAAAAALCLVAVLGLLASVGQARSGRVPGPGPKPTAPAAGAPT